VGALDEAISRFGAPGIMDMEHGRATGPSGHATPGVAVHLLRLDQPPDAAAWTRHLTQAGARIRADLDGGPSAAASTPSSSSGSGGR